MFTWVLVYVENLKLEGKLASAMAMEPFTEDPHRHKCSFPSSSVMLVTKRKSDMLITHHQSLEELAEAYYLAVDCLYST